MTHRSELATHEDSDGTDSGGSVSPAHSAACPNCERLRLENVDKTTAFLMMKGLADKYIARLQKIQTDTREECALAAESAPGVFRDARLACAAAIRARGVK